MICPQSVTFDVPLSPVLRGIAPSAFLCPSVLPEPGRQKKKPAGMFCRLLFIEVVIRSRINREDAYHPVPEFPWLFYPHIPQ